MPSAREPCTLLRWTSEWQLRATRKKPTPILLRGSLWGDWDTPRMLRLWRCIWPPMNPPSPQARLTSSMVAGRFEDYCGWSRQPEKDDGVSLLDKNTESRTSLLLRWRIAILVSLAIAISYLDRQTLPVAVTAIARDIPLSNQRFSALQSAFLLSYAFMYLGGGRLVDALGTRIGFEVIMTFWSLANASHALATSFAMLMGSRFLLGMGEGGGFPAATRAVAEWFTPKERATAMGIINAGTAVGAVVAPPLIAVVLSYSGWRWIFVVTGGLGLLWAWWWKLAYPLRGKLGAYEQQMQSRV